MSYLKIGTLNVITYIKNKILTQVVNIMKQKIFCHKKAHFVKKKKSFKSVTLNVTPVDMEFYIFNFNDFYLAQKEK